MHSISFIVTCHQEQQLLLQRLLQSLLTQEHPFDYEIIVVDKSHDKDLGEWLEEMEAHYPQLSHTFCPASSRGIDPHLLALTLGAKSASSEWLVVVRADIELPAAEWLKKLPENMVEQFDVVMSMKWLSRKFRMTMMRKRLFLSKQIPLLAIVHQMPALMLCRRSILLQPDVRIPIQRCNFIKN